MAYHRQQGVDTAIVRIFNTYGPRMRAHDGRAIPTFVRQALSGEPITVFGDGGQTRSFCYVDDLVDGILAPRRLRRASPRKHRQSRGVHVARAGREGDHPDRFRKSHRLSRRCRRTIPSSAAPTSPAPASCSAGRRASASTTACACCSSARAAPSSWAGRWAREAPPDSPRSSCSRSSPWPRPSASADQTRARSAPMLLGVMDDALLGNVPDVAFPAVQQLHPQVIRYDLSWARTAPRKPADATESRRSGLRLVDRRPGGRCAPTRWACRCCSRSRSRRAGPAAARATRRPSTWPRCRPSPTRPRRATAASTSCRRPGRCCPP